MNLFLQLMHELKRIIIHDDIHIKVLKRLKPFGMNDKQIGLNSPDWSPNSQNSSIGRIINKHNLA